MTSEGVRISSSFPATFPAGVRSKDRWQVIMSMSGDTTPAFASGGSLAAHRRPMNPGATAHGRAASKETQP